VDPGKPTTTNFPGKMVFTSLTICHNLPVSGGPPGAKLMVVVHTNGIHYLPVHVCRCPNAATEDIQLLQMRYYPSTYKQIGTIFTFQLLDDYLLENLECQTSTYNYFQKLRRMTNKAVPQSIPVSNVLNHFKFTQTSCFLFRIDTVNY
jgi:hypothetical protein